MKKVDVLVIGVFQVIILVLFGIFVRYDNEFPFELGIYPMFQDTHVMIFVGFGFLMTFLKRYSFSAVGFNFLLASMIIQWAILSNGFYDLDTDSKIRINTQSLLGADFAAAVVLISMGAVLGRTTPLQLILMGVLEIALYSANAYLGIQIFKTSDAGGSIFVHAFGAYFGLATSYVIDRRSKPLPENPLQESSYTSDMFAMAGTVFLWIFWPSFNAAEQTGINQNRAIVNTYLALASCCVTSFLVSQLFSKEHKFDMVHIQNSTLAGGVAVGTSANLLLQPYGALIVGILAGALSVVGYSKISPFLTKKIGLNDTCGVHNLHGMPAVLAALVSAIVLLIGPISTVSVANHRAQDVQAGYQVLAITVTLVVAIFGGLITGSIITWEVFEQLDQEKAYDDIAFWIVPGTDLAVKKISSTGIKPSMSMRRVPIPIFALRPFIRPDHDNKALRKLVLSRSVLACTFSSQGFILTSLKSFGIDPADYYIDDIFWHVSEASETTSNKICSVETITGPDYYLSQQQRTQERADTSTGFAKSSS